MKNIYFFLIAFVFTLILHAQIIDIPDANFKNALLSNPNYNTNGDDEIQASEAANIYHLVVDNQNIASLEGIEHFTGLYVIWCRNNQLTTLDVSMLPNLHVIWANDNLLTEVIFPENPVTDGEYLFQNNQLTSVTLPPIAGSWEVISFENNQLNNFEIEQVNTEGYMHIESLALANNQLNYLNLSNVIETGFLLLENNELTTLIANGGVYDLSYNGVGGYVSLSGNDNLSFVCVGFINNNAVISALTDAGITDCYISTYCPFTPGNYPYSISGTIKIDNNLDGCDGSDSDANMPLNFLVSTGDISTHFIGTTNGDYSFPLPPIFEHTITPELENPAYYSITPTSITIPEDNLSDVQQDFCITPNGTFNDLEVTLLPLEAARPGFDADYRLVYKNNGTTTLSGSVVLTFQDDIMDLVTALPVVDSQAVNTLVWNFADLAPFEIREIDFTMNINSPMETPPVNGNDVLVFEANVIHSETDETPDNNISTLNQTVVNSFDPNDKTCLEGDVITPAMVGEYVHYMIRFENTGTANAINVAVKDVIDTTKFDLSSFLPLHGSHYYISRIVNGNEVEFLFEDINLPFDDANNDGFVIFKIKTLDTLQVGDTFENNAEIYFDYNFPIITNTTQTSVQTLSIADENLDTKLTVYPNPSNEVVTIETVYPMEAITLYDATGRIVQEIKLLGTTTTFQLPTKNLAKGNYFVKVIANNKTAVKKLMVL